MAFTDDQDFPKTKLATADYLVACRLILYYRMAAQVSRNCARKLLLQVFQAFSMFNQHCKLFDYENIFYFTKLLVLFYLAQIDHSKTALFPRIIDLNFIISWNQHI